jgi:hypothetical protein
MREPRLSFLEWLRRRLRGWRQGDLCPDITLLGWPGKRFWHGHLRWRILYGDEDWKRFKKYAEDRHQQWLATGKPITFQHNFRNKLYLQGPKKDREDP